jgi:hypothetical protein
VLSTVSQHFVHTHTHTHTHTVLTASGGHDTTIDACVELHRHDTSCDATTYLRAEPRPVPRAARLGRRCGWILASGDGCPFQARVCTASERIQAVSRRDRGITVYS